VAGDRKLLEVMAAVARYSGGLRTYGGPVGRGNSRGEQGGQ